VWLEGITTRRFTRVNTTRLHQWAAIVFSAFAATAYHRWRAPISAGFYLWTGSQAMMLLPRFWVLALDVWDSRRARVLFPVLSGFGLLGGLIGGAFAGWTHVVHREGLMWILTGLFLIAHLLTLRVR